MRLTNLIAFARRIRLKRQNLKSLMIYEIDYNKLTLFNTAQLSRHHPISPKISHKLFRQAVISGQNFVL